MNNNIQVDEALNKTNKKADTLFNWVITSESCGSFPNVRKLFHIHFSTGSLKFTLNRSTCCLHHEHKEKELAKGYLTILINISNMKNLIDSISYKPKFIPL